jgi:sugar/nucleoside kinase (ribokinase family)
MVMVTPDAERSMSTFLGATADLDHTALHEEEVAASQIYYMEGYLAASPSGLDAALKGRQMAKDAGVALATTLSDVSMINFCRDGLNAIIGDGVDYLFCNEEEAQVWCGTQDLDLICQELGQLAQTVCLTRGPLGCLVLNGTKQISTPALSIKALDTNGAGDMFAGAFLYAMTQGCSHLQAAWLANQAAGQVVGQYGNRLSHADMGSIKTRFGSYLEA